MKENKVDLVKSIIVVPLFALLILIVIFVIGVPSYYALQFFRNQVANDIIIDTSNIITYAIGLLSLFIGFLTIGMGALAIFGYATIKKGAENKAEEIAENVSVTIAKDTAEMTAQSVANAVANSQMKEFFERWGNEISIFKNLNHKLDQSNHQIDDNAINILLSSDSKKKESDTSLKEEKIVT